MYLQGGIIESTDVSPGGNHKESTDVSPVGGYHKESTDVSPGGIIKSQQMYLQ